jgi:fumarate hydratase class II
MNANEVIAGRANEMLTGKRGGKEPVHPNDHVNLGQSSNDVIPTVIHVAAASLIQQRLIPALEELAGSLGRKTVEFAGVMKIGRTHLQDAVPVRLGDEFGGYARQVELGIQRAKRAVETLCELALGGTAVGNGVNAHPGFARRVIEMIAEKTGCGFREARNHFEAQAAQDSAVEASGEMKTIAVSLVKIANDIRLMASGPRCGIGEISIPALQPGSSIMPGKVNPVMPEMVIQVAAQVIGNDATVTFCGQGGYFELNTMLPVIALNLIESVEILAAAAGLFAQRCVAGITANRERCRSYIERSLALSTYLVPYIGYDKASEISKEAFRTGETVREVAIRKAILPDVRLDEIFREIESEK